MIEENRKSGRTLWLAAAVILASFSSLATFPGKTSAYTPHDSIYIEGDAYFIPSNGVVGGNGTESDPYIIGGWDITPNTGCAIVIKSTGRHFVIRDVYLHDGAGCGIYLRIVANARIEDAIIADVGGGAMIAEVMTDSEISNNNISGSGIDFDGAHNVTVAGNHVVTYHDGINIWASSDVTIRDNNIDSTETAVPVRDSSNVRVFHNRIKGDQLHAVDTGSNQWDDGYPSGGNYWSNYTGSDTYSGPAQDQPGRDGIGDTPFIIDNDSQDRYPLIPPDVTPPTVSIENPVQGHVFATTLVLVDGTASDLGGSGLDIVKVRLNGDTWADATGTYSWNASLTLTSGSNSIEARAWDNAGNPSSVASVTVIYSTSPIASFTISPAESTASAVFAFDASACSDLEDSPTELTFRWDWEDDGVWDTSWTANKTASHQFAAPGKYTVRLEVKDTVGLTNSTTRQVTVSADTTSEQALQWWLVALLVAMIVATVLIVLAFLLLRKRKKTVKDEKSDQSNRA